MALLFRFELAEQSSRDRSEGFRESPHLIVRSRRRIADLHALRAKLIEFVQERAKACKSQLDRLTIVECRATTRSHSRRHQSLNRSRIVRKLNPRRAYVPAEHTRCQSYSDRESRSYCYGGAYTPCHAAAWHRSCCLPGMDAVWDVKCPSCGSSYTSLVQPNNPDEFAYRCFACGRRWSTFAAVWPRPMDRAADRRAHGLPPNRLRRSRH